jgi:hypothetical protein
MTARPDEERSGQRAVIRRDHVAGGVFIVAGVLVFAMSGDLPFGTLASPGAGMMPKLVLGLPLATINWGDFRHAATVVAVTAVAAALYTTIGFVLSVSLLLFVLLYFIEKRSLFGTLAVSVGVTVGCYLLFGTLLKSPLPPMPFWN